MNKHMETKFLLSQGVGLEHLQACASRGFCSTEWSECDDCKFLTKFKGSPSGCRLGEYIQSRTKKFDHIETAKQIIREML